MMMSLPPLAVPSRNEYGLPMAPESILASINAISGVKSAEVLDNETELKIRIYPHEAGGDVPDKIISVMKENNFPMASLFVERGRLDDVFRTITGG